MSSSAERVLAIPELCEHIFLFLCSDHGILRDLGHAKDLFSLQRLNRSAYATVQASLKLRRAMGTVYSLPKPQGLDSTQGMLTALVAGLPIQPFEYRNTRSEPEGLTLNLELNIDKLCMVPKIQLSNAGMRGKSGITYNSDHCSWRKIKLSNFKAPPLSRCTLTYTTTLLDRN